MNSIDPCGGCAAPRCTGCPGSALSRRNFLANVGTAAVALPALRASVAAQAKDPVRQTPIRTPLKVQPVLLYDIPKRRQATSWRPWGGVQTEQEAAAEKEKIRRELAEMSAPAGFPLEILSVESVQNPDQAAAIAKGVQDVTLVYAASGGVKALEVLTPPGKWNLVFVRHRSGPVYLWYEIAHPRFLRKTVDEYGQPGMGVEDVVVDSHAEVLYRLRGLYGLKNILGKRIVAVGGPGGWGVGGRKAPERAREVWKLDIQTVSYPDLGERIQRARQNDALVKRCHGAAEKYLKQKGVALETPKQFVLNSFVLTEVFRDLLDEARTDAITINQCMGTIMPISETSACLPLNLLNDDGYMAFCESDFVVIPSGILLHYISGKPVFLNDPTYPHDGLVTQAHCTAPRRMDGQHLEPVRILTHFESDYGAAPKVEMKKGQRVTNLVPDFAVHKWVGFEGEIVDNPFLAICRSQIDVQIKGDTNKLLEEMKGFHWMTCYGDYLRETGYALKKVGVDWLKV
jgi:hypothetical protein